MSYVPFDVDSINWDQFLSVQEGGQASQYFVGQRYMRGYGVLGSIGRFLLPIAKNLASTVGSEGVEAGSRILKDVTEGKNFGEAIKEHSKKGFENLTEKMKQCGKGTAKQTGLRATSETGFERPSRKRGKIKNKKIKKIRNIDYKTSFESYPPRPASPTIPIKPKSTKRKRKPDQLDIF
jgi:hypothetical protein